MGANQPIVSVSWVARSIFILRRNKVMLDMDLARIYGVSTKRLNEQVKRNRGRFPKNFIFQLTKQEFQNLRSQIATSSQEWGGHRYLPYAFTEHGTVMLATILNSPVAIRASIYVVQAFVKLRESLATHKDLARRLDDLETKYDSQFKVVFDAVRQLMAPPEPKKKRIGFLVEDRKALKGKMEGRKVGRTTKGKRSR